MLRSDEVEYSNGFAWGGDDGSRQSLERWQCGNGGDCAHEVGELLCWNRAGFEAGGQFSRAAVVDIVRRVIIPRFA